MSNRNHSLDLIPIRIDIESEGHQNRYIDAILWKIQEDISPEYFAELLCHDEQLPLSTFKQPIISTIHEYIQDYQYHKDSIHSMTPFFKTLSFIVNIDIIIDNVHLVDHFQWPLNSEVLSLPTNNHSLSIFPEYQLSDKIVTELGLSSSFRSMISFSIIEQMYWIKRTFAVHQSDFIPIELQDIIITNDSNINTRFRSIDLSIFTPQVSLLTDHDVDQLDITRERETRRAKRQIVRQKQYRSNEVFWSSPSFDINYPRLVFKNHDKSNNIQPSISSIVSPIRRLSDTSYHCSKCNKIFYMDQLASNIPYICSSCRSSKTNRAMDTESTQNSEGESLDISNINPREGIEAEKLTPEQKQYIPDWMDEILTKLLERHPKDFFYLVVDGKEVKVKCYDCDKIYMPGPNRTLSNFEVHLRNKQHCKLVRDRILDIKKRY